jgi:hypothetical protein
MPRVAFVLGGANCLYDDLDEAFEIVSPDTIIATNNAGRDFPHDLPHWVTLHTEKMPEWMAEREKMGYPKAEFFWTSNTKTIPIEHSNLYNYVPSWDGSSGLLAVTVALFLGYRRIILCGVPLDKKAAHYDDDAPWMDAPRYRSAWNRRMDCMQGKVKSFSGWTKMKLGYPTRGWCYGEEDYSNGEQVTADILPFRRKDY